MMRIYFWLFVFLFANLTGCSSTDSNAPLKISVNKWIGYAPLVYAEQVGWLEPLNIKLIKTVSLGESSHFFSLGISDAFTGTQHEYYLMRQEIQTLNNTDELVPVILLDRSNGGDAVLANRTLEQLRNLKTEIQVYFEVDTINNELFEAFIEHYRLQNLKFKIQHQEQASISSLKADELAPPTLIVTYTPYTEQLRQNGFQLLDSSRNLSLFIIDAVYMRAQEISQRQQQINQLKAVIDRAIAVAKSDPQTFYQKTNFFLEYTSFSELEQGLAGIHWENQPNPELLKHLTSKHIPTQYILP